MPTIAQAASEFLAKKRIAVTGVSRNPQGHGSNIVYQRLKERGYEVFAVNPNADKVGGDACYHTLGSIPGGVDAVVIGTRPETADGTMQECADLGIKHVWMHRSMGGGASRNRPQLTDAKGESPSSTAGARACSTPPRMERIRPCASSSQSPALCRAVYEARGTGGCRATY